MPVLDQPSEESDPSFYATLCIDLNPIDPTTNYFPMSVDQRSRSLIFNSDKTFDDATRQRYILGSDTVWDRDRNL